MEIKVWCVGWFKLPSGVAVVRGFVDNNKALEYRKKGFELRSQQKARDVFISCSMVDVSSVLSVAEKVE